MEDISAGNIFNYIFENENGQGVLDLSFTFLSKVPKGVTSLQCVTVLEVFDLSHNHYLKELPKSINKVKNLKELKLNNNMLCELPEAVGELINLTLLNVSNNNLSVLPSNIKHLTKLQWLHLGNNRLTTLPDGIGELKELIELNVSNNYLSALPADVKNLKKLHLLGLQNNRLRRLPDDIGDLEELKVLFVSNNQLSVLPTSVRHLKKLLVLYLKNNCLTALPEEIGDLEELLKLNVSDNQLSILPTSIKRLKKLQVLHLNNNLLMGLPQGLIGNLKYLEVLSVNGNALTFKGMRGLMELWYKKPRLFNNTGIAAHLREQSVQGQRAQLAYEMALRDGYVRVYRGRVVLIGQDGAGKTSLKKSLLGLPFDPKERSTEGIEVDPSKCEIKVDQVKKWNTTDENTPGLLECSKDIARMMVENLCDQEINLEFIESGLEEEAESKEQQAEWLEFLTDERHFESEIKLSEQAYMSGELPSSSCDRKDLDLEAEQGNEFGFLGNQVDENGEQLSNSDISSSALKADEETKQDNSGYFFTDWNSENATDEPDVMINATSPPVEITKHAKQWLKFVKGECVWSDIRQDESVVSMDLWDFAGQHLYYATHPVFLSSRAIYILVHNLSKPLNVPAQPCARRGSRKVILENPNDETNVENLLSWLATIHTCSVTQVKEKTDDGAQGKLPYLRPPVLIVGTHADKPFEDITVMNSQIQERISHMEYEKHVIRPFFSIDNTRSVQTTWIKKFLWQGPQERKQQADPEGRTDGIQALRNRIMEVLSQEPYMGEKIPVRWFMFEKLIEALVAKEIYHRNLVQLQTYARKECFIEDAEEFANMISFYHGLGMIIKHRNTVVLKAQWLIDLFKQLITIPHYDKMDPVYSKYWQELERNGILTMELVDYIFSRFLQQGVIKEDILDMMERFGLIAKFSASTTEEKFFVPAQLKSSPQDLSKLKPSHNDPCPLYLDFVHGFVPHGLFAQLVSRSIRWCYKNWPIQLPKLYQNGAWFVIGAQIHDFILICRKRFIKIVLRQRTQSHQVLMGKSAELATLVRGFVERTLQNLSQELPYLSGLQYELCVTCPYCHQGTDETGQACSNHNKISCTHEECFHLLEIRQDRPLICMRKVCDKVVHSVYGQEKWFLTTTGQELSPSTTFGTPARHNQGKSETALRVTLLASEWSSSMGGLSTINRQLATLLAKHKQVEVTLLVPQFACSEEEKRAAKSHSVTVREAERRPGFDPLDWLSFPPSDLAIDIVLGHGGKLGKQAQVIRKSHSCLWVQVVHTAPEELAMHKTYSSAISKGEEKTRTEVDLCKLANLVVAVGPKLKEAYASYLRLYKHEKHQNIIQLTPGTLSEFADIQQATTESDKFKVLTFGRGDPEDFSLKGYDIAAKAIVELKDRSYCLIFVGAPDGKQEKVANDLLQSGISKDQLIVRKFAQSKERLKELFCEADLAIMPSRTEGFGLTALEALSAGLPILVSGNSGFGDALRILPLGKPLVVDSADPKDWAKAIRAVRLKNRADRLEETQRLRTCYEENYSWEKQCEALVKKMWHMVHG